MPGAAPSGRASTTLTLGPSAGGNSVKATVDSYDGSVKLYIADANAGTITFAMIESRAAMDNLEAIAAMPGIDSLFVGPSDLSCSLSNGASMDSHSAEVEAALEKVLKACDRHNKIPGLYCRDADRAVAKAKAGFRFLAIASDLAFLRAGTAAQLKVLK